MNKKKKLPRIIARDISWLSFNERVLQEALDTNNPLIERLRFLGIFSSNMDEFFRVRYASIRRLSQIDNSIQKRLGGKTPVELLTEISNKVIALMARAQEVNDQILKELEVKDIAFVDERSLTAGQQEYVRKTFIDKISPAIFTLILKDEKTVPELKDKSIYLAIRLIRDDESEDPLRALIEIPSELLGRFWELPKYGKQYVMYLEDVIRHNLDYIFFIYKFDRVEAHTIKITRDAELDLDDDVSKGFLEKMSSSLESRRVGDLVRFVYDKEIHGDILQFLINRMDLDSYDSLIPGGRYHNKKDYIKFPNLGDKSLEFEPMPPVNHPDLDLDRSILNVIREKDVMLFLPYQNFSYIIRTIREAALDPQVTQIHATLYRLGNQSRIISALINAAKNGKRVTVVIELRARFDEEANIKWTKELQTEGVQVIFGVPGLKLHAKMILITRETEEGAEYFASLGTGNFNEQTAKTYTDYHLLTADPRITADVINLFDFLQSNYKRHRFKHLIVSPYYTRRSFLSLIETEIENAKEGKPSGIRLKINSLSDVKLIEKLYEASEAGVQVKLIIRGICSLVPGIKPYSLNIEAISILDRFLEHTRVFIFENNGAPKTYIGSADWMTRNLDGRIEVTTPIYDERIAIQLRDHFEIIWKDNVKSRSFNKEMTNVYRKLNGPKIRSQHALYDYVKKQLRTGKL